MIAHRLNRIKPSGIRKIFDLAKQIENPINLSIGEPDFDIPEEIKAEGIQWIQQGFNKYTASQGLPELREQVKAYLADRRICCEEVMITSGVSGGITLALMSLINPGDEVLIPDPYFVLYEYLVRILDGVPKFVDTYPDFTLREEEIRRHLSPRSKLFIVNNPNNPTGRHYTLQELSLVASIARERNLLVMADDIYEQFTYDGLPHISMGSLYKSTLVLNGFSKSWGMLGWRLGFAAGPRPIIEAMTTLQQFTFVCAPSFAQKAGILALQTDVSHHIQAYQKKRDLIYEGLRERYQVEKPGGAFYIFPQAPAQDGDRFVEQAIGQGLLLVPGSVFSQRPSHFRLCYAAPEATLLRGLDILRALA